MKTSIKFNETTVTVSSVWANQKPSSWDSMSHQQHHIIKVQANGETVNFDFWASQAHPRMTTDADNIGALACYISDAMSGEHTFEDFCDELGYESDEEYGVRNEVAHTAWNSCRKALRATERMGVDVYDLYNYLNEHEEYSQYL